jgi:hypothetical protein
VATIFVPTAAKLIPMFSRETVAEVDVLLERADREPLAELTDQQLRLTNLYARRLAAVQRQQISRTS